MPPRILPKRLPSVILVAGVALAGYYLLAFKPLSAKVLAAEKPLVVAWERLVAANQTNPACAGLDLENFTERLQELRSSATNLETAGRLAQNRIALDPRILRQMADSFQLLDFQDERLQRNQQLVRISAEKGVTLEPGAANGLPEYASDIPEPSLLWARLHLANQLLLTAIQCKVGTLRTLTQLPPVLHSTRTDSGVFLEELPMRLELTGPMDAVTRFLICLPLTGSELKPMGLAESMTNKPALFIDQLLIRKLAPDKPEHVQVEMTVVGFAPGIPAGPGPSAAPDKDRAWLKP